MNRVLFTLITVLGLRKARQVDCRMSSRASFVVLVCNFPAGEEKKMHGDQVIKLGYEEYYTDLMEVYD